MSPFVRDMHEKNGLIERVRASRVDQREAERQLLSRLASLCDTPRCCAVAASGSIARSRSLHAGASGYLHYRMVDVSSLRILVDRGTVGGGFVKPARVNTTRWSISATRSPSCAITAGCSASAERTRRGFKPRAAATSRRVLPLPAPPPRARRLRALRPRRSRRPLLPASARRAACAGRIRRGPARARRGRP